MAGGVSANSRLRAELKEHGDAREMPTFVPSLSLSTDNAAMIAAAGLRSFRQGRTRRSISTRTRRCALELVNLVIAVDSRQFASQMPNDQQSTSYRAR